MKRFVQNSLHWIVECYSTLYTRTAAISLNSDKSRKNKLKSVFILLYSTVVKVWFFLKFAFTVYLQFQLYTWAMFNVQCHVSEYQYVSMSVHVTMSTLQLTTCLLPPKFRSFHLIVFILLLWNWGPRLHLMDLWIIADQNSISYQLNQCSGGFIR